MGINITRHNFVLTLIIAVALLALFWVRGVVAPVEINDDTIHLMPLGLIINLFENIIGVWPSAILIFIISIWSALLMARILIRNMLIVERTYTPIIIYIIISCGTYLNSSMLPTFIVSYLVIEALDYLANSFSRKKLYSEIFISAVLIGLTIIIYSPSIIFLPATICGLILFRKKFREWVVSITGILLPFATCSYVYWGLGYSIDYVWTMLSSTFVEAQHAKLFVNNILQLDLLLFWGIIALVTLLALIYLISKTQQMRTRPHKTFLLILWTLIFSSVLFITSSRSALSFPLAAVPISIIISTFLNKRSGALANYAYLLIIICVVIYNLRPII